MEGRIDIFEWRKTFLSKEFRDIIETISDLKSILKLLIGAQLFRQILVCFTSTQKGRVVREARLYGMFLMTQFDKSDNDFIGSGLGTNEGQV